MKPSRRTLILCGGMQSSGSTLISWCFLQRPDMNGVLDANNDILPSLPPWLGTPYVWYKTTICCFRLKELIGYLDEEGWDVRPLLVVRDVRRVWSSLAQKPYGRNGVTAEDPPLRLRLSRFHEDWQYFRRKNWPTLLYEDFLKDAEGTLRRACRRLELPWHGAMLEWPKPAEQIFNPRHGNKTFWSTRQGGLKNTLRPLPGAGGKAGRPSEIRIPAEDLHWLEREFEEFNRANGYPLHLQDVVSPENGHRRSVPSFQVTRRYKWELRRKPIRCLLSTLGFRQTLPRQSAPGDQLGEPGV